MPVTLAKHEIANLNPLNLQRIYALNLHMTSNVKTALHIYSYDEHRTAILKADLHALTLERLHLDNAISVSNAKHRKLGKLLTS